MLKSFIAALALAASATPAHAADEVRVRGYYHAGPDMQTFHPCGSRLSYWVVGEEVIERLRKRILRLAKEQPGTHGPFYIEVSAIVEREIDPSAEDDFGFYRLTAIHEVKAAGPADCPAPAG